jgi:hypothetical protein
MPTEITRTDSHGSPFLQSHQNASRVLVYLHIFSTEGLDCSDVGKSLHGTAIGRGQGSKYLSVEVTAPSGVHLSMDDMLELYQFLSPHNRMIDNGFALCGISETNLSDVHDWPNGGESEHRELPRSEETHGDSSHQQDAVAQHGPHHRLNGLHHEADITGESGGQLTTTVPVEERHILEVRKTQ